jgi:N utilization substance protein B
MGKRRAGRELAFKVLFQIDVAAVPCEEALQDALTATDCIPETFEFARRLVSTTVGHLEEIDRLLARHAKQWPLERMANVDRSLLRIAACEILYCPDIPPSVSIDEAVELAKKYSTTESGRFINGILGGLLRETSSESGS